MRRKFAPFDEAAIREEFAALPPLDCAKLARAMKRYQEGTDADVRAVEVQTYSRGIHRIKSGDPKAQGRGLFSRLKRREGESGPQVLVLLSDYKKQSAAVPRGEMARALERKKAYEQATGRELH